MPKRKAERLSSPAPLSRTEQRAAKVDAYAKDQIADERNAEKIKRQKLKALRTGKETT
jgi:hypothetical protein